LTFTFKTDWELIRHRYEAWWERAPLERPIVRITAPRYMPDITAPPADTQALLAWYTDPAIVLPRLEAQVDATHYTGDAFPWVDPMSQSLAAIQAAYLGAPYRIDPHTLTGWADPIISNWQVFPGLAVDPGNFWWQATQRLLADASLRSQGRYMISIPDLQGGGEILALLRGSEALAYDLVDQPEVILPAVDAINRAWLEYFKACYAIIHRWQPGYVDWLGIWSDLPAVTVECDYALMVSPRMFARYFLPGVAQQVSMVARSVFHLDGPGAIPHLDNLLSLPDLRAIQWVPTPDRPSPLQWIPLLRRIQAGGKGVVVACSSQEVLPLLQALNPEDVILTTTCATPVDADALLSSINQQDY